MTSVDERVVNMKFNNAQFEAGVSQTLNSLAALNKGLKVEGATKGLEDLGAAGNKLQYGLGPIADGVGAIADKFKTLSIIGITALSNIVTKAVDAGLAISRSLTVEPITSGLHEYEQNLNAIQTILANTQVSGVGLKEVNAALDELNHYADLTIYDFGQMTKNIGTFTAAGVGLKTSVEAIKGIANLAALSGSSAEQASTAMYQLSQAIASGRVSLEDWNSVVNAGMGGTVFQRALAETAVAMGKINAGAVKLTGDMKNVSINGQSFRDSITAKPGQQSWLTSDVLLTTLKEFTGDLSDANLKAIGFKDSQIAAIQQMAANALHAATEVKTLSGVLETAKEAAGSGWAETWRIVFGDFNEAKTLFTNVSTAINGFIGANADARNKVLSDWKLMGGRTVLIDAISQAFKALTAVVTPIKQAFRQIFPATTARQLFDITNTLRDFFKGLIISGETADKVQHTFAGLFAVVGIGFDIVKEVAKVLLNLFGIASKGSGSFLDVTAKIGDFLVNLKLAIEQGNGLHHFFEDIGKILAVPIKLLQMAGQAIAGLFKKFDGADAEKKVGGFVSKLEPMARIADAMINAWGKVPGLVSEAWSRLWPFAQKIGNVFSNLAKTISGSIQGVNFTTLFAGIGTVSFASIALSISSFIKKLKGSVPDTEGLLDKLTAPFDELTNTLKTMQTELKARALLEIAAAIGLLTIAVVAMSRIDTAGLTRALTAIGIMFGQLIGTLYAFEKVVGDKATVKMLAIGAALILLSIAVDILATAVLKLSSLDWNSLIKGLTGLVVILGAIVGTLQLMPNDSKIVATSIGLIALATAINILVNAVTNLSGLSWEEMAKGLIGVGALLGALTLFTRFAEAGKAGLLQGAGIILLATGIKILASALKDMSTLSWQEIARGLTAMGGGLLAIGIALKFIPPSSLFSAAGILIVATSLGIIGDAVQKMSGMNWSEIGRGITVLAGALILIGAALIAIPPSSILSAGAILVVAVSLGMITDALKDMGKMSWGEIAKSLVELAASLAIIAGAMYLMEGALPGALALIVVAASLQILAPVLQMFGNMSWEEMGKGLLMLAGVFLVLGVAGALLTPVVPTLLGLGVAITLIGVGTLAAGVGTLAFAAGLTALSIAGVAGTAALVAMVAALAGLIPYVMTQLGLGLVAFAKVIATAGPAFAEAMTTVLMALLTAIDNLTPKIIDTLFKLLNKMFDALVANVPHLTDAGLKILIGFLNGIANNIGKVVDKATDVIVAYINGISRNLPRIVQAGVDLIINFINGMANTIRNSSDRMTDAGINLASAIIEGMIRGLARGVGRVADKAREVAKSALDAAMHFLDAHSPSRKFIKLGEWSSEGLAIGLDNHKSLVGVSATNVANHAIESLRKTLLGQTRSVFDDADMNPKITPVLDLTDIHKNVGQIDKVLAGVRTISLDTTTSSANSASSGIQANQQARAEDNSSTVTAQPSVQFNQYNNSPKPLNAADIYRQTNNQLSKAKGALTPSNA